jgi:ribosomal protein S18 acetylase RimI-like enzyme
VPPVGSQSFRAATPDDVAAIVDLVDSAYRGERSRRGWTTEADVIGGQRVDEDMVREALGTGDGMVLLLLDVGGGVGGEDQGVVVACCELRSRGDGSVALGMFAVDPRRQDSGLGRRVLDEAERIARDDWAANRVELSVIDLRLQLIEWYERRGYRRTGATLPFPYGDDRFGLPRRDDLRFAVMEKRLGPVDGGLA